MSATAQPITPAAFAEAIQDLPVGSLHGKAAELHNSIHHLRDSNQQLKPFSEEGDQDCIDAIQENEQVIERMQERIRLLRVEVERRGLRWSSPEEEHTEGIPIDDDAMDVDTRDGNEQQQSRGSANGERIENGSRDYQTRGENRSVEGIQNGHAEAGEDDDEGVHL